jgi:release factor glutamine methyltransferase
MVPATETGAPAVAGLLRAATARLAVAGIATARQDAECLLARALGTTRLGLRLEPERAVSSEAHAAFATLIARRARHEPFQYLVGEAEFCGVLLRVGPGVFVPRPETEALVTRALALAGEGPARVADLCAGSGAIACALAARRPDWTVWAVDRAPAASACARDNVRRLGLAAQVRVLSGDLFGPLGGRGLEGRLDLVVANPPYLATAALQGLPAEVREWEPRAALDGGEDGLVLVRRVVGEAPAWLRTGGGLLVEIGEDQGAAVRALVAADGRYEEGRVHRDFRGAERLLEARRR